MPACDRAVQLSGQSGWFRDSRGLARALSGDVAGAIDDFQAFVTWCHDNMIDDAQCAQREGVVAALEQGQNPFDAATLDALRHE